MSFRDVTAVTGRQHQRILRHLMDLEDRLSRRRGLDWWQVKGKLSAASIIQLASLNGSELC